MVENNNQTSENPIMDMLIANNQQQTSPLEEAANVIEQVDEPSNTQEEVVEQVESTTEVQEETVNEEPTNDSETETPKEGGEAEEEGANEIDDWYDKVDENESSEEGASSVPSESLQEISKALGIEGYNDEAVVMDELKSVINSKKELETKIQQLESESPFASDEMAKANEIMKNGGDWRTFLQVSDVNYDSVDDNTMLMEGWLIDALGSKEDAENHLETMTDSDKKLKANSIRANLKQGQEQQKLEIQKKANERKQHIDGGIKKQLDGISNMYGVKISSLDKKQMFNSLTSEGGLMNQIFYNKDKSLNFKGMVEAAFVLNNMKKIVKQNVMNAKNQGVKSVMNEVSNANLDQRKGTAVKPSTEAPKTAFDKHFEALLRNGN